VRKTKIKNSLLLPGVLLLTAALTAAILLSCSDLEQKYIKRDKLFRIAHIEDSRVFDSVLVGDQLLGDPDPEIRARAAVAVGRIGGDHYARALLDNLRDSVAKAAEAKYFAAGLIGDTILFDSVFQLARSKTTAREAAVEALGRIANSEQAPRLTLFLDDPDSRVVYQAMLAMLRAEEWSEAEKMAGIGLTTANRRIKYGAVYALSRAGRPEGRELYRSLITDADPEYRMLAYRGLGRMADSSSVKQIAGGLNDADDRVVAAAMYALEKLGDLGAMFIGQKLPDLKDEKLVTLGLDILGRHSAVKNVSKIIRDFLEKDNRDNVLASAVGALLRIEGVEGLQAIDRNIKQPTVYQKQAMAEGMAEIEPSAAKARLMPLFNDEEPSVRAAALESLCRVDSAGALDYLQTGLADDDFVVTATAVEIAAARDIKSLAPDIADIYLTRRDVMEDDLKRAIIAAWDTYGSETGHDSLVIASLEEGCNDEWFVVRQEASEVLYEHYGIDRRNQVSSARTTIEKRNFRDKFYRYEKNPRTVLSTSRGEIVIELLYDTAPKAVNNFIALAEKGFYDSLQFHRVIPNFVVQDGCPRGDGWGGPGYAIRCEYTRQPYTTGAVGMATSGKDSGGSQYFITLSPQPHLDARYTLFGRVVSGMDIVKEIVRGDTIIWVTVEDKGEEK